MLSLDEDGLDDTIHYGPQHSTPVKGQLSNHNHSGLTLKPKNDVTVTKAKKQFKDSNTSPHKPTHCHDCVVCSSGDVPKRSQCNHMAQHFFPDDDVDISQIPCSEASQRPRGMLKEKESDKCPCSSQCIISPAPEHCRPALKTKKSVAYNVGKAHCESCVAAKAEGGQDQRPQCFPGCHCQTDSTSPSLCHHSKTSTLSRRSDICFSNSTTHHNYGPLHQASEASLSVFTSECFSPKRTRNSSYDVSVQSFVKNTATLGTGCSGAKFRSHSLPRTGCSGVNLCNHSTEVDGPTLSMADISKTPAVILEDDTISKQREEIQLLMEELAGRDQELNDLVSSHQKQVRAWEADREKLEGLQVRLTKYEAELSNKEQQLSRMLEEMGRVQEQKDLDIAELGKTRADMVRLAERIKENSSYIHEIELQNQSLNASVKDLSAHKKHLEEREHELLQRLDEKNADSMEQQTAIKKLSERITYLENQVEITEEKCRRKIQENEAWRTKFFLEKDEAEKLAADCDSKDLTMSKMAQQLQESLQQAVALQKALFTSCEREKCKEEVLHSLRRQHKRTMQELTNIRELYDLQCRDLTTYHLSVKDPNTDTAFEVKRDKSARSVASSKDQLLVNSNREIRTDHKLKSECEGDHSISNEQSESNTETAPHNDANVSQSRHCKGDKKKDCTNRVKHLVQSSSCIGESQTHPSSGRFLHKTVIKPHETEKSAPPSDAPQGLRLKSLHDDHISVPATSHARAKTHPQKFSQCQSQTVNQPSLCCNATVQQQQSSHGQPTSDQSHYSTASATSKHSCVGYGYSCQTEAGSVSQGKPQTSRCKSPVFPLNQNIAKAAESGRKIKQNQEHKDQQLDRYLVSGSSPRRKITHHPDENCSSTPRKKTVKPARDWSPLTCAERQQHQRGWQLGDLTLFQEANVCTSNASQVLQHQHKIEARRTCQKQNVDKNAQYNESVSHFIEDTKHPDISMPFQCSVKNPAKSIEAAFTPSVSPKKVKKERVTRGVMEQREMFAAGVANCHGNKENKSALRQGSYVITEEQRQQGGTIETVSKETCNRVHKEEKRPEQTKNLTERRHSNIEKGRIKEARNDGHISPKFCQSPSDVSNSPSPSRFDDELTPADSDGMCRELKRDLKNVDKDQAGAGKSKTGMVSRVSSAVGVKPNEAEGVTPIVLTKVSATENAEERKLNGSRQHRSFHSFASQDESVQRENPSSPSDLCCKPPSTKGKKYGESGLKRTIIGVDQDVREHSVRDEIEQASLVKVSSSSSSKKKKRCRSVETTDNGVGSSGNVENELAGKARKHFSTREHSKEDQTLDGECQKHHREDSKSANETSSEEEATSERHIWQDNINKQRRKSPDGSHCTYPQFTSSDQHPCVSPQLCEIPAKRNLIKDQPATTSSNVSPYYSTRRYGSPNPARELCTSRHLHTSTLSSKAGLGLGAVLSSSIGRTSGVSLSPTKSMGGSYSSTSDAACRHLPSSGLTTQCSSGSGLAATTTTLATGSYSGRRFLTSGVGSYLSRHLNPWYHGTSGLNYALNNNNDNDSCRNVSGDDDDDDDDDERKGLDERHLEACYLNTNNNNGSGNDINVMVSPDDTFTYRRNKKSDNNSFDTIQDNLSPSDIQVEQAFCSISDGKVDSIVQDQFNELLVSGDHEDKKWIPAKKVSCNVREWPQASGSPPDCHASIVTSEVVPGKAFANRSQRSLYRQLAQIHFSEKTRRYEWLVVPPYLSEVQTKPLENNKATYSENTKISQTKFANDNVDTMQGEEQGESSMYNIKGVSQRLEGSNSFLSEDNCQVSSSFETDVGKRNIEQKPFGNAVSTRGTAISYNSESNSGPPLNRGQYDSGLCSLGSWELHPYSREKADSGVPTSPQSCVNKDRCKASHGFLACNCQSCFLHEPVSSVDSAGVKVSLELCCFPDMENVACNGVFNTVPTQVSPITACFTHTTTTLPHPICCASLDISISHDTEISSNNHNSTDSRCKDCRMNNKSGNNNYSNDSLLDTEMDSFMGVVKPSQKETLEVRLSRKETRDHPQPESSSCSITSSLSLDGVKKKLNFDDSTLFESQSDHFATQERDRVTRLGTDKDASKFINSNGHENEKNENIIVNSESSINDLLVRDNGGSSKSAIPYVHVLLDSISEPASGITDRNKCILSPFMEKKLCPQRDDCHREIEEDLTEYFQDISTLQIESASEVPLEPVKFEDRPMGHDSVSRTNPELVILSKQHKTHNADDHCILLKNDEEKSFNLKHDGNSQCQHSFHLKHQQDCHRVMVRIDSAGSESNKSTSALTLPRPIAAVALTLSKSEELHTKPAPFSWLDNRPIQVSQKSSQVWNYKDSVQEAAEQFDDKMSCFLEERELKENTQKVWQGTPPPMSPASKLHHLLIESQHLIWALERSSAVPEALMSNVPHL